MYLKKNFGIEFCISRKSRTMLSNFRVFSNHLRIEICRYGRDRVNRQYRICNMCSNDVENKYHCVIKCPLYEGIRNIDTIPRMEKSVLLCLIVIITIF